MNEQQIKKCVGDRIREERKIWGWSQEVLAEKLYDVIDTVNVGGTAISSYERGATMPSVPVLYALAEVFHVTVDYLMGRSDKKNAAAAEIISFTGLTEEAAGVLHAMNEGDNAVNQCDIISGIIMHGQDCFMEAASLRRNALRMATEYKPFMGTGKSRADMKLQRSALEQVGERFGPSRIIHGERLLVYQLHNVGELFERVAFKVCGVAQAIEACRKADAKQRKEENKIIKQLMEERESLHYPKNGKCPKCKKELAGNEKYCPGCGAAFTNGGSTNAKE